MLNALRGLLYCETTSLLRLSFAESLDILAGSNSWEGGKATDLTQNCIGHFNFSAHERHGEITANTRVDKLNELTNQSGAEAIENQVAIRWVVRLVATSCSLIVSALILVVLAIFAVGNFITESARK